MIEIPEGLSYWTPDEVAECLDGVSDSTYVRLWAILDELEASGKAVPVGGDGSGGTIETPPEPDAFKSGKMAAVWDRLTEAEQIELRDLCNPSRN